MNYETFTWPNEFRHFDSNLAVSTMTESNQSDDEGSGSDANGTIRTEFDWSVETPTTAVVETVAVAASREPVALEPLYETVDPDALDTLVRSREKNSTDGGVAVTFAFDGYEITVHSDGTVVVRPVEAHSESE